MFRPAWVPIQKWGSGVGTGGDPLVACLCGPGLPPDEESVSVQSWHQTGSEHQVRIGQSAYLRVWRST